MNTLIDTGGPAFPPDKFSVQHCPGLTKREYIAIAAMQGMLAGYMPHAIKDEGGLMIHESIFRVAFECADKMLIQGKEGA